MSAWEKIKIMVTKGSNPETLGYIKKLNEAIDIFIEILPELKNQKEQESCFNADKDVVEAIASRKFMQSLDF